MRIITTILFILFLAACGGGDPAPNRVVAIYGDSVVTGRHGVDYLRYMPGNWSPTPVERIAEQLPGWTVIDAGRDGARAQDVSIAPGADLVVLSYGVTDTRRSTTSAEFGAAVAALVAQARAQGAQVLIVGLPHTSVPGYTSRLDGELRRQAAALGVRFVDVQALPFVAPHDLADSIFPSEGYSRRIGELVADAIRSTP